MGKDIRVWLRILTIATFFGETVCALAIEPIGTPEVETYAMSIDEAQQGDVALPEGVLAQAAALTIVDPKNSEPPKPAPTPFPPPDPEPPPPPVPPSRIVDPETEEPVIDSQPDLPDVRDILDKPIV